MKINIQIDTRLRARGANDDDRRLVLAAVPVFLILSIAMSSLYGERLPALFTWDALLGRKPDVALQRADDVYPVLVEQAYAPPPETKQIRALSNVDAEGKGALTEKKGFHTLSNDDTLDISGRPGERSDSAGRPTRPGAGDQPSPSGRRRASPGSGGEGRFRIPSNYRFQQQMRLNYDRTGSLSIARKKIKGFRYFQHMLRKIRGSFAPPGINMVQRDYFGTYTRQTILPQAIQVLFLIDSDGNVRDVRVVRGTRQKHVEDSCVLAIRGQNFGPPPAELLEGRDSLIVGITFVFPPIGGRR